MLLLLINSLWSTKAVSTFALWVTPFKGLVSSDLLLWFIFILIGRSVTKHLSKKDQATLLMTSTSFYKWRGWNCKHIWIIELYIAVFTEGFRINIDSNLPCRHTYKYKSQAINFVFLIVSLSFFSTLFFLHASFLFMVSMKSVRFVLAFKWTW